MERVRKASPRKYFIAPIIGIALITIVLLYVTMTLQVEIQPTGYRLILIDGGPDTGSYTVLFALWDANYTNGPANGFVMLKIRDTNDTILYNTQFTVRSDEFKTYDDPIHGGNVIGYSWQIPVANVSRGVPDPEGYGEAELTFLSFAGHSATATVDIKIPSFTSA